MIQLRAPAFLKRLGARKSHLYLHIGEGKTGTTAIQKFLKENVEAIESLGFHVPRTGWGITGAHHDLVRCLQGFPVRNSDRCNLAVYHSEIRSAGGNHIISSETLLTGLTQRKKQANEILGHLARSSSRITMVCFKRDLLGGLNSKYQQSVCAFQTNQAFSRRLKSGNDSLRRAFQLLELADSANVELELRPYTQETRINGIVPDFCEALGIDYGKITVNRTLHNKNNGIICVLVTRHIINRLLDGKVENLTHMQAIRMKKAIREFVDTHNIRDDSYCGFTPESASRYYEKISAECDSFAGIAWGKQWEEVFGVPRFEDYQCNDPLEFGGDGFDMIKDYFPEISAICREILENKQFAKKSDWNVHVSVLQKNLGNKR